MRSSARRVDVEGTVETLWNPPDPSLQQVGLLEDETGKQKLTVWKRSNQVLVEKGQRVRIRDAAVSWDQDRTSLALTGR